MCACIYSCLRTYLVLLCKQDTNPSIDLEDSALDPVELSDPSTAQSKQFQFLSFSGELIGSTSHRALLFDVPHYQGYSVCTP